MRSAVSISPVVISSVSFEEKPPKPRFRVLCCTEELTELITTGLMETADRIAAGLDIDPRISVEKLAKQRAAKAAAERAKLLAS